MIQLDLIIDDPATSVVNRLKAMDLQGKMSGWHSQTTNIETNSRQNELNEADRQEAQQLAVLRFNPKYALPPVESEIVYPGGNGESVGASGDIIENNEVDTESETNGELQAM